ncbi:ADP-ribosylglycohydrolase family protein [Actinotalea sp. M2MS4P-6]|uniref:ADP-ribosylglycohydrolase family protein n=1 Tax=Actinotalea sp. M2MS4P-6 TaxID=2983762 RepID=UPI0021E5130F|nr:ADP-ribosylglycohydrolase family protein [Actinotalea sp. M2MS4P-6]MCV2393070.1 ADP-ribosylglycohydrolase family protein [Actinotalea sp. M2MS4P-6]
MDIRARVRGLTVGYCLGDALARVPDPGRDPLLAGTPSLIFLHGVEAMIRSSVREDLTGRGALPACSWHATARWAWSTRQGHLPQVRQWRDTASPQPWPDGWLAELSSLAIGRGSAPAVEAALELEDLDPRPGWSPGDSAGDLVLSRTLPVALLAADQEWSPELDARVATSARDVAAYSHGLPAQVIAVAVTRTLAETVARGEIAPLADPAPLLDLYADVPDQHDVRSACAALAELADPTATRLPATELARAGVPSGPRTALRALAEALRCTTTHPARAEVDKALREALETGQPGAAALAGAMLGAAHGVHALPVDAVARLDLAHVADQLAGDLALQVTAHPALVERDADTWLHRYPAW